MTNPIDRCELLGVWANTFTVASFLSTIQDSVDAGAHCVIGNHNLHSIYLYHRDAAMRAFFGEAAQFVFIDGMPLILWGKCLGYPLVRDYRFTAVDWLPLFMQRGAAQGWRVFYLGGQPGIAETGAQRFRAEHPGLQIATAHGHFDIEKEGDRVIDTINNWKPDVLLVGMGMPRQERWLLHHHARLQTACMITVGAAIDYFAGAIPTPPRWMGRLSLEWLARLMAEPRRLGTRYFVEPWFLLPYMAADVRRRVFRR